MIIAPRPRRLRTLATAALLVALDAVLLASLILAALALDYVDQPGLLALWLVVTVPMWSTIRYAGGDHVEQAWRAFRPAPAPPPRPRPQPPVEPRTERIGLVDLDALGPLDAGRHAVDTPTATIEAVRAAA